MPLLPQHERSYGSVYTGTPVLSPKYQISQDRSKTQARLGIIGLENRATSGEVDRFKDALSGNGYINFLLSSVQESFSQIHQITPLLGGNYSAWFYGEQPPIYTFTGTVLNTKYDMWKSAITAIYSELANGTSLAASGMRLSVAYDSVYLEGALVGLGTSLAANDETAVPFSFQLLVTLYNDLKVSPDESVTRIIEASSNFQSLFVANEDFEGNNGVISSSRAITQPELTTSLAAGLSALKSLTSIR